MEWVVGECIVELIILWSSSKYTRYIILLMSCVFQLVCIRTLISNPQIQIQSCVLKHSRYSKDFQFFCYEYYRFWLSIPRLECKTSILYQNNRVQKYNIVLFFPYFLHNDLNATISFKCCHIFQIRFHYVSNCVYDIKVIKLL